MTPPQKRPERRQPHRRLSGTQIRRADQALFRTRDSRSFAVGRGRTSGQRLAGIWASL